MLDKIAATETRRDMVVPQDFIVKTASTLPHAADTMEVKVEASKGVFGNLMDLLRKTFGFGTAQTLDEPALRDNRDRVTRQMDSVAKQLEHEYNLTVDEYNEARLMDEAIRLLKDHIHLGQNEFSAFEINHIHKTGMRLKAEIDKKFEEQQKNNGISSTLGKIGVGTTTACIGLALAVGAVTVLSGGTVPTIIMSINTALGVIGGGTSIAKAFVDKDGREFKWQLDEANTAHSEGIKRSEVFFKQVSDESTRVLASWQMARRIEEEKINLINEGFHDT